MVRDLVSDPERRCSTYRDSSPRASLTPSYKSAATGLQYVARTYRDCSLPISLSIQHSLTPSYKSALLKMLCAAPSILFFRDRVCV
jgi:hypothetical protein